MHRFILNVFALFIGSLLFFANGAISVHYFVDHYSTCDHHHDHDSDAHDEECPVCDYEFASFAPFDRINIEEAVPEEGPSHVARFDNSLEGEPGCLPSNRGPPQRV